MPSIFSQTTPDKLTTLKLGNYDASSRPANFQQFLHPYHKDLLHVGQAKQGFRDEGFAKWRPFVQSGYDGLVAEWQAFLTQAGFLPLHQESGIFGYVTLAATRLFQEYVRSIEKMDDMTPPDGIVGKISRAHAQRWADEGKFCHWYANHDTPNEEYNMWLDLMEQAKKHYTAEPHAVLKEVAKLANTGDSIPLPEWSWPSNRVHLLGIRNEQEVGAPQRVNDDLFILLIAGKVFKFYGSTDPRPKLTGRSDEPYLVEGQHRYRMAWHKIGEIGKVYKALKPYTGAGVLAFRDRNANDALDETDVSKGLTLNNSINIHWSGIGSSNWSAGCQVIAGAKYMNSDNEIIDCTSFAAVDYKQLDQGKTRGAYNLLSDLVLVYSGRGEDTVWYTLGRDDVLDLSPKLGKDWAKMIVHNLKI